MKRLLLVLCAAYLTLAADSRYNEDFHYSFAQSAGGKLSVENVNGSVEISGWDQNTVEITGTKYADSEARLHDIRIDVSNGGNWVQVKTVRPEYDHHGNLGAKFVIHVPRQTELERVRSSNGRLRVENVNGNVTLHTSNGSVHISGIKGNVEAHSSNGSVHALNVRGGVNATTSNGSMELEIENPQNSDVIAATSNGTITLKMPAATNAAISAHTSGHDRIYSDFDVTVHGGQLAKSRLDGTIGGGGPKIDLSTSNGNIRLLKI